MANLQSESHSSYSSVNRTVRPTSPSGEPLFNETGAYADKILRGEISAIEAYEQVIAKFADTPEAPIAALRRICADHEDSCTQLRQVVTEEKIDGSRESGAWGGFVKTFVAAANLFGEGGALRALKAGEEHGLKQYEEALGLNLSTWEKNMVQNVLIPKQKEHISQLETLLIKQT